MIARIKLNLTVEEALVVRRAMRLLDDYARDDYEHILREIEEVTWSQSGLACPPGSLACTGGVHGRRAVLTSLPSQINPVELAVVLSHEARHHYTDPWGRHFLIAHVCSDCGNLHERAWDPIYAHDDVLRHHLYAQLWTPAVMTAGYVHHGWL